MPAQRMETPITIREAVLAIKARDYLLPAIQREFVWTADKTEALFDSLLRGYPVGSFLFWRVDPKSSRRYKFYEFMQDYHALNRKHLAPYELAEPKTLTVVLDGQQRLTSLSIGLLGYRADKEKGRWTNNPSAYKKRRLYLSLSGPYAKDDERDRAFDFRFLSDDEVSGEEDVLQWFPVREVMNFASGDDMDMSKLLEYIQSNKLNQFGGQTLLKLCQALLKDQVLHYFQEDEQDLNRVLNIFVRLNSGGIPLSYSDLLLSIATAQWSSDARQAIYGLVDELNAFGDGFDFDKDFALKSALVLTDRPSIKFSVENFDTENTKAIEKDWEKSVREPLLRAVELAAAFGYNGKTLSAANVLIPIAYHLKKIGAPVNVAVHPKFASLRASFRRWLVVSLLKSTFSSKTDTLLAAVRAVQHAEAGMEFPMEAIEKSLAGHNVLMKFTEEELESLVELEYGKRNVFSVLAAAYPALNAQFKFHLDHIHPKSKFSRRALRAAGFEAGDVEYLMETFNQIPNLQMLEGVANQSKLDTPFEDWTATLRTKADAWSQYCAQHLIPKEAGLALKDYKKFFDKRRALLLQKLRAELPCMDEAKGRATEQVS